MKFSTPDRDNGNNSGPLNGGVAGWWFNNCSRSILNLEANAVWNAVTDAFVYDVVSSSMLVKLVD